MEVGVNSGNDGIFAASIDANDGMVVVASITTAQLMMITTIAATTISQRCHHHGFDYIIVLRYQYCSTYFTDTHRFLLVLAKVNTAQKCNILLSVIGHGLMAGNIAR